ncbi:unnamed protein product [Dracunculus medinensis]|uniref:Lipocln_cytosolic_FA-bd_dom domain-containing protein n=1 Tax=Dracunculus medinensis TaxID=318479 RepID=A0A0N4UIR5_DRAME|nr:unnamed protein product [Dracunculus medinensis]
MDFNTITGIIGGISNMIQNNVETIEVPASTIMGRWFQMYKAAVNFDVYRTEMFCPVAYFRPNVVMGEDGFSIEEAYRVISKNGPVETYKKDLNKVGPGQYWMYTEEYFYPRQFYIIKVGPNYSNDSSSVNSSSIYDYMVVTDASRLSLMVYARDPMKFFQNFNKEVVEYLEKAGFGGKIFWNTPRPIYQGSDCEWPSEKEVFARRVLKNQEIAQRSKNERDSELRKNAGGKGSAGIAEMLKNPQMLGVFNLPHAQRFAAKPTVPPELKKYFELDDHALGLVDSVIGPRPGGFFPPKSYEIGRSSTKNLVQTQTSNPLSEVERTLEHFLTGSDSARLPPGFNQGFSLSRGSEDILSSYSSSKKSTDNRDPSSSIRGIPNVYPDLSKPPVALRNPQFSHLIADKIPGVPFIKSRPEVPEGGFAPDGVRRAPSNYLGDDFVTPESEYGALTDEDSSSGGLIGTIINLIGLNGNKETEKNDAANLGKAVGNLIGSNNSPIPAKDMISNVLYKALTSGSVQGNDTDELTFNFSRPIELTSAQKAAIGENLEMIQSLITQPSSPLCNPKPIPVSDFNIDAFMGQWYQVMYSPPLASGPCSMVAYKKLADVNNGGAGTIFEIFEYTSDGTPYVKPRISSGYAILKQSGELIYRTTSNQDDVNVHVIYVGPLNSNGEYSFTILSTNCNYPIYVFARDPVVYRQRHETTVNQILEEMGLVNGFSRLFNIIAPVDNSICSFPPSLFNIQG